MACITCRSAVGSVVTRQDGLVMHKMAMQQQQLHVRCRNFRGPANMSCRPVCMQRAAASRAINKPRSAVVTHATNSRGDLARQALQTQIAMNERLDHLVRETSGISGYFRGQEHETLGWVHGALGMIQEEQVEVQKRLKALVLHGEPLMLPVSHKPHIFTVEGRLEGVIAEVQTLYFDTTEDCYSDTMERMDYRTWLSIELYKFQADFAHQQRQLQVLDSGLVARLNKITGLIERLDRAIAVATDEANTATTDNDREWALLECKQWKVIKKFQERRQQDLELQVFLVGLEADE